VTSTRRTNDTLLLDTAASTERFLEGIAGAKVLAIDTEGASFHRYVDRIYLLQLSTATRHAIIDPLRVRELSTLGTLLESRDVEVVFHDADYDLRLLHQDYGWRVSNIFDTRVAAQLLGIKAFGLAALLESFFGVKLDKKHQRADWSMRPLPRDMLDYAAQDTMHLLGLRDRLHDALVRAGRWSWAEEEFLRLEGTRWEVEDPSSSFFRIKGARDLSRRELAILRELVAWRDAIAREMDRSTFRVMGNETLLEVARRAPETREALSGIRGVSRSLLDGRADALIAAVARGRSLPESELPKFPKAPRWERDPHFDDRVSRLRTARDAAARRLELDAGVLCPRERLEAVARRVPRSLDELATIPDVRRWQVAELGESFLEALTAT
jgi:ribonuclease D